MDWYMALAVTVSYVVKGMFGFANSLVFGSMLGFRMDNAQITPIDFTLGYPANLFMAWKLRRSARPKVFLPLAALTVAGALPGVLLLQNVDARGVRVAFGLIVMIAGAELLLRGSGQARKNPALSVVMALLSGITCGMFNVGALLAAHLCRNTENQDTFKADISAIFFLEATVRLVVYCVTGMLNWAMFRSTLILYPFLAIGLAIGMWLSKKVGDRVTRTCVLVTLILSGLVLSVKGVLSLLG